MVLDRSRRSDAKTDAKNNYQGPTISRENEIQKSM
jgi:hypothetical protein